MKASHVILGVHLTNRLQNATDLQKTLSQFGCSIKTRIGLHEVSEDVCSPEGIVILELFGDEAEFAKLETQLKTIAGIEVQKMVFSHPSTGCDCQG